MYDYVAVNPYIEANKTNPQLIQSVSGEDALERNIHKLQLNRIDVILETATVFEYINGKLGIPMSNYDEAGGIYKVNSNNTKLIPIFIGLSPKNPKSKGLWAHQEINLSFCGLRS